MPLRAGVLLLHFCNSDFDFCYKVILMKLMKITFALAAICLVIGQAEAAIVLPNNGTGETFTNGGGTNQGQAVLSQAVGGTGWYYNNVRNGGSVGINANYPQTTTGSAYLAGNAGPGGASSKADIEYLVNATDVNGNYYSTNSLGTLQQLTQLSYEWFRDSSSSATSNLHPVVRILVDADGNLATTTDRGGLVFERSYNGGGAAPTDAWTAESVTLTTNLWSFGANQAFAFAGYNNTLSDWISGTVSDGANASTINRSSLILGFSMGVGSGWGPFEGAVDNFSYAVGANSGDFNFEVQADGVVPEPMTIAVWSVLGLCGSAFAWRAKRRQLTA